MNWSAAWKATATVVGLLGFSVLYAFAPQAALTVMAIGGLIAMWRGLYDFFKD